MADEYDRFLRQQYYDAYWLSVNSKQRILREYDFFSEAPEKLKQVHVLPWPENPAALQEFFVPGLISPLHKEIRGDSNTLMKTPVEKGKNATAPPPWVRLFDKRVEDSDLIPGLDRLLISKSEKLMGFLSEGERLTVEGGGAVTVILETKGGVEKELGLVLAKMDGINDGVLLVKDDWSTIFRANNSKVGDLLLGWGVRRHDHDDGKFRLKIFNIPGSLR